MSRTKNGHSHRGHSSEGAIRERGGRWQVDARVDGQRVRRAAASREEAEQMLREIRAGRGEVASPQAAYGPSVSDLLTRYLSSTRLHCRPRTVRTTVAVVKRMSAFFEDLPASELTRTEVDRYSQQRLATGVGPHTPNRDLACLRAALSQAKDDGLLDRVPKIRMLRTVQPLPNILSKEEITRMIDCAGDLRSLIATAATAGLRAAELRWMQWENVDLEEGQIDIRAKGGWRPKSHSERTVPIPKRLVELLRGHQSMVPSGPEDWVFPVPTHGGQWTESGLSHAGRRIAERAGVWRPRSKALHDLRRSWASHLLARGTPMDTVRRLGGWASSSTLEKFYLAPTDSAVQMAIDASEDLLA